MNRIKPNKNKRYRRSQRDKGLVRYEIQIPETAKNSFEKMVRAVADEYVEPYNERGRLAKARIQIFNEITQGVMHEFFTLKDQIQLLKEQIAALSPSFFKTIRPDSVPIPDAINALPDDPKQLKAALAKTYREAQQAKYAAAEYKQKLGQISELYELSDAQNEELRKKLKINDISIVENWANHPNTVNLI